MPNGKALQAGTSHDLSDNFSKAFNVNFLDEKGKKQFAFQSSFGLSTRSIAAIILAHGDDSGLIMPPNVAPIQVVILPIIKKAQNETNRDVVDYANSLNKKLKDKGIRTFIDNDDIHSLGYKINE
jgi:prolyl-tRNA synthetase